jgi:hypothetical protein
VSSRTTQCRAICSGATTASEGEPHRPAVRVAGFFSASSILIDETAAWDQAGRLYRDQKSLPEAPGNEIVNKAIVPSVLLFRDGLLDNREGDSKGR